MAIIEKLYKSRDRTFEIHVSKPLRNLFPLVGVEYKLMFSLGHSYFKEKKKHRDWITSRGRDDIEHLNVKKR